MIVHYFASVREKLGIEQEEIELEFLDVNQLIKHLSQRGEDWQQILMSEQTLVAVNQKMAQRETALEKNSEVAFFPFMTGG